MSLSVKAKKIFYWVGRGEGTGGERWGRSESLCTECLNDNLCKEWLWLISQGQTGLCGIGYLF